MLRAVGEKEVKNGQESFNPIQTGLFWSICDWGGLLGPPPPSVSLEPIMLGS